MMQPTHSSDCRAAAQFNRPPVARCHDLKVTAGVRASIDNGSYDPDGDAITFSQNPPGPYPIGSTPVTLTVTDSLGLSSSCSAWVYVEVGGVACTNLITEPTCLDAQIVLSQPDFAGYVFVTSSTPGVPASLVFEALCAPISDGPGDTFEFYLNNTLLAQAVADSSGGFDWCPPIQSFTVSDAGLIASAWNVSGNNTFRFIKSGYNTLLGWARVRLPVGASRQTLCICSFSYYGCDETCVWDGYVQDPVDQFNTMLEPFIPPLVVAPYQDSLLPPSLDISSLDNGNYQLCVNGTRPNEPLQQNCVSFVKNDQPTIIINGPGGCQMPPNRPPVAKCHDVTVVAGADCTAAASIDNGSYDPDGDPITITQNPPGPYPIDWTLVEMTVTDSKGLSSSCSAWVYVQVGGLACMNLLTEPACLDAQIVLSQPDFTGYVFVPGTTPGVPPSLVYEVLSTPNSAGPGDTFEFYLNNTLLGQVVAD